MNSLTTTLRLSSPFAFVSGSDGANGRNSSAENGVEPLEAGGRPQGLRVVVDVECRRRFGKGEPGHLRPREDVDVGGDRRRLVERPCADEAHFGPPVLA